MSRVEVRFDGVSRGARRAGAETEHAIDRVGTAARRNEGRVVSFGRSARSSLLAIGGVAARAAVTIGGLGAAGLAGSIVFAGFRFNDLKQRAEIAFKTMLGSGEKARRFLGELAAFAAKTPFEFKDLIPLSQRLLSVGFEAKKIIPILGAVGEAVSAMGGSPEALESTVRAITQIQSKGRVMAEEMMQLNEAGTFSWRDLAREIGVSVPRAMELVSKGAVSSEAFMAAFVSNTERRFKGLTEAQSHSFAGLLSTIKDTFNQASGTAMEPFFKLATRGMQAIVDWSSKPEFAAGVQRLSMWLEEHAVPALRNLGSWLVEHRDGFADAFRSAAGFAQGFARAIGNVKKALSPLTGALSIDMVQAGELAFGAVMLSRVAKLRAALIGGGLVGGAAAAGASGGLLGALKALSRNPWTISVVVGFTFKGALSDTGFGKKWNSVWESVFKKAPGPDAWWLKPDATATQLPGGLTAPIPAGQNQGIIGTPGQGTHDQADWQSRNAVDVKVRPGTPVLAPEPMRVVQFREGPATPTRVGTKIVFGDQITYLGKSGTSYFITHMRSTARRAGVFFGKGAIIGFAVNAGAGTHVHIATDRGNPVDLAKTGGTTKTAPTPSPAAYETGAAGAGVSFGDAADLVGPGTGTDTDKFDRDELKGPRATLNAMKRMIGRLASPELKAKFRKALAALLAELGNVDTDKELAKLRKKLSKLQDAWFDAMSLRDQLPGARRMARQLADRIANLPDEIREKLMPRLKRLQEELGHVVTEKQLDRIKRDMDRVRDTVERALDRLRDDVAAKRDAFGEAFQRLTDKALRVFDAQTDRLIRNARAKVARFGFEIGAGEETPGERRLREFREGRDAAGRARRRAEIERRIAQLSQAPPGETPEEQMRRLEELAQAQQDLQEFMLDETEAGLQKQADAERRAADEALEAERERIRVERELLREKFQQRLIEIQQGLLTEKLTAEEAQAQLLALLAEYGLDLAEAGALIGAMFAAAFQQSLDEVRKAIAELAAAIAALADATGNTSDGGGPPVNAGMGNIATKGGGPIGFAHGGKVPGVWMGREDTMLARVSPGETVIDRHLTRALEQLAAGRGLAGGVQVHIGHLIGQPDYRIAEAWAAELKAALDRVISL